MMKPVRVLHVLHSMNCGGAEALIMNIYRNIDREKVQFDFLVNVFDKMFYEDEISSLGGRIFRMRFLTSSTPVGYDIELYRFFKSHSEIRIVHSHLETTTGIILRQAKLAGVPVRIAHSHNSRYTRVGLKSLPENVFKSYCRSFIVPNATELFGCSELANEWLYGKNSDRAKLIKNGIDTEKYRFSEDIRNAVRNELGINNETKLFGHVGRFNDQKNHLFLIDIFAEYLKRGGNAVLALVGEGELTQAVKDKADAAGISDRVKFLGLRSDVNRLLQAFDVFVFPSKFEGLPFVLVEAQASGLLCIVSDKVSQMAELGGGMISFLPIDSAEAWAEKLEKTAADISARAGKCETVAACGYDIKETAGMLEKFYLGQCD